MNDDDDDKEQRIQKSLDFIRSSNFSGGGYGHVRHIRYKHGGGGGQGETGPPIPKGPPPAHPRNDAPTKRPSGTPATAIPIRPPPILKPSMPVEIPDLPTPINPFPDVSGPQGHKLPNIPRLPTPVQPSKRKFGRMFGGGFK